jgi:hypothetical protein
MNAPSAWPLLVRCIKFVLYESSIRPRWRSPSARRSRCTNGALVAAARYVGVDLAIDRERQVGGRARGSVPRVGEMSARGRSAHRPAQATRGAVTDLAVLQRIDAVGRGCAPRVHEFVHRVQDWQDVERCEGSRHIAQHDQPRSDYPEFIRQARIRERVDFILGGSRCTATQKRLPVHAAAYGKTAVGLDHQTGSAPGPSPEHVEQVRPYVADDAQPVSAANPFAMADRLCHPHHRSAFAEVSQVPHVDRHALGHGG